MSAKRPILSLLVAASVVLTANVAVAQGEDELQRAASADDVPAIERIVTQGVALEARDQHGRTALLAAAQLGHKKAVLALLAAGADLEATDENGYTSLIWAAQQGHTAVVAALLARGANVEAREKHDYGALEWAAWEGHANPVRLLLAYGANPGRRTRWGFTAEDLAKRHGRDELARAFHPVEPPLMAAARPAHAAPVAAVASASATTFAPRQATPIQAGPTHGAPAQVAFVPPAAKPLVPTISTPPVAKPASPVASWQEIGRSRTGQSIRLAQIGRGDRRVLFIGSIHGDEAQGTDVIHRLLREVPRMPALLARNQLLAIPNANPDGVSRRMRTNLGGVDLNRNFPTHWRPTARGRFFAGPRPLSEPESQALQRTIEELRPELIVSFHAHMACNNFDGAAAEPVARAMARLNGYRLMPQIGYETPGSLGQHAAFGMGIPIVTLEVGFEDPEALWRKVRDSLLVALEPRRL